MITFGRLFPFVNKRGSALAQIQSNEAIFLYRVLTFTIQFYNRIL